MSADEQLLLEAQLASAKEDAGSGDDEEDEFEGFGSDTDEVASANPFFAATSVSDSEDDVPESSVSGRSGGSRSTSRGSKAGRPLKRTKVDR